MILIIIKMHRLVYLEHEVLKQEESAFVRKFFDELSVESRELAYLYYYEDMSINDIAYTLNKKSGTVKWQLFEIRNNL